VPGDFQSAVGALRRNYRLGNLPAVQQINVDCELVPRDKNVFTLDVAITGLFENLQISHFGNRT
jgi:hypothetical protein